MNSKKINSIYSYGLIILVASFSFFLFYNKFLDVQYEITEINRSAEHGLQELNKYYGVKLTSSKIQYGHLQVRGTVPPGWLFEAQMPAELLDENNQVLSKITCAAEGVWMVEADVSFLCDFKNISTKNANWRIKIKKDNPSGLPEHDGQVIIPLR